MTTLLRVFGVVALTGTLWLCWKVGIAGYPDAAVAGLGACFGMVMAGRMAELW